MSIQAPKRELDVITRLPHQNILTLHGVCEPKGGGQGQLMLVYELMSSNLAKLLQDAAAARKHNPNRHTEPCSSSSPLLATHVLLRVLRDVSAGLTHLHAHQVIHRDVKPANVLLRGELVKLCDFGSSKDFERTMKQTVTGTVDYMAPELLDKKPANKSADVWSFGVLMFECVVGKVCGRSATKEELVAELLQAGCLPEIATLCAECHQQEPSKRPLMSSIHNRLQQLVMQDASDSQQRLKEDLKRAEIQDRNTYDETWKQYCGSQSHSLQLLEDLMQSFSLSQTGRLKQQNNHQTTKQQSISSRERERESERERERERERTVCMLLC